MIAQIFIAALSTLSIAQADMQSADGAPSPELVARKFNIDLSQLSKIDNSQRETARIIGRDLCCLCGTCPKEPVTDCRCGWAQANRQTIEFMVARGMSREQILTGYREVYGDKVLGMLPNEGFARTAWILPYGSAIVGLVVIAFVARHFVRKGNTPDLPPELEGRQDVQQDLARELNELD